jgi:hypothetical protein
LVPEPGSTWQGTGIAFKGRHRQLPAFCAIKGDSHGG